MTTPSGSASSPHLLDVHVRFESEIVDAARGTTADGRRIYTLDDVYPQADLVTYPSSIEGFGNAFLEAVYHRRPIVVNRYSIYEIDIKPHGFRVVEFDNYVSRATIEEARRLLRAARPRGRVGGGQLRAGPRGTSRSPSSSAGWRRSWRSASAERR